MQDYSNMPILPFSVQSDKKKFLVHDSMNITLADWSWCSNHAEFVVVLVCENLELSCCDYFCSLLATKSAAVGCVGVSGFKICILDDLQ